MASSSNRKAQPATATRTTKLRRLEDIRRSCPYMSASALSSMLKELEDGGMPELHWPKHMKEASDDVISSHSAYGSLVSEVPVVANDGTSILVHMVNLLSLLQGAFGQGGSFTELMLKTIQQCPCSVAQPWGLILYFDEVTPGDPVGYANKRKFWVAYVSFKQFGSHILANEACWLPLLEFRTEECTHLAAGISQVCKHMIKGMFQSEVCDVSRAGLLLKGPADETVRLFFNLAYLLQDGAAHKMIFHTKGDTGTKFCCLCRNLLGVESDIVDPETELPLLLSSITYESECDMATDEDLRGTLARLKQYKAIMTTGEFNQWQKAVGFKYEPHGLLADESLQDIVLPATNYVHDWMHTMFVTGVFHTTLQLLLLALCAALNVTMKKLYEQLNAYVGLWVQPRGSDVSTGKLSECFSQKRLESNTRAKTFKCKASDGLGLYAIIGVWLKTIIMPMGVAQLGCEAFVAMCLLVDYFIECAKPGAISPWGKGSLSEVIDKFLKACIAAGWRHNLHPKFHWLIHFPTHLWIHGFLISCWVHERLHKVSKRYANNIQNTIDYEMSLLRQVLCHTLAKLRKPGLFDITIGLKDPRKPTKKALQFWSEAFGISFDAYSCQISNVARIHGGSCSVKDVVLIESVDGNFIEAGEVWSHASCLDSIMTLVSMWKLLEYDKPKGLAYWQKSDNAMVIFTSDILRSVSYRSCEKNVIATVVPLPWR